MTQFIQLHVLTSYPPSCLNRDDLGRPKTAVMGGRQRLRISSQSLKRAWRTSDLFQEALGGHIGTRTKDMGKRIYEHLKEKGVLEAKAKEWAKEIASQFGKPKSESRENPLQDLEIEQLAHFSPEELAAIDKLVEKLAKGSKGLGDDDLKLLKKEHSGVDIAMFGRFLADEPKYTVEAAVQVGHAITVHEVAVEDDYFTAVDDLNVDKEIQGAGHIGETEFGAGVFYTYICINLDLLIENLSGNGQLTQSAMESLVKAATMVGPTGKQSSFASRAYASYILAEKGTQQPRSLSIAFLKPVSGRDGDMLSEAIDALEGMWKKLDTVYGSCSDAHCIMDAYNGKGSLEEVVRFVKG